MPLFRRGKQAPCYSEHDLLEAQQRARRQDRTYQEMEARARLANPAHTHPLPAPRPRVVDARPLPNNGRQPIDRRGAPPRYTPHATRGDYVEDRRGGEAQQERARAERARLAAEQAKRQRDIEQMEADIERRKRHVQDVTRRDATKVAAYQRSVAEDAMHGRRQTPRPIDRTGATRYAQAVQSEGDVRERFGEENARGFAWTRYRRALAERAAREAMTQKRA